MAILAGNRQRPVRAPSRSFLRDQAGRQKQQRDDRSDNRCAEPKRKLPLDPRSDFVAGGVPISFPNMFKSSTVLEQLYARPVSVPSPRAGLWLSLKSDHSRRVNGVLTNPGDELSVDYFFTYAL